MLLFILFYLPVALVLLYRLNKFLHGRRIDAEIDDFMEQRRAAIPELNRKHDELMTYIKDKMKENNELYLKNLANKSISFSRHDYIFSDNDYKRNHDTDRDYNTRYKLKLFKLYNNKCANCGDESNGADIDHFIFSKREGGSFVMKTNTGSLVNNAILLCEKCNRSKSDKSFKDFFTPDKIAEMLEKNKVMTELLNKDDISGEIEDIDEGEREVG